MTLKELQDAIESNYIVIDEDWPNWLQFESRLVYSNGEPIVVHIIPQGEDLIKLLVVRDEMEYDEDAEIECGIDEYEDGIYEIESIVSYE